jgi:ABC-type glycerol-3-phosphate transport system substrate-binding protein
MQEIVSDFNKTVGKANGIWVSYISMSAVSQKTLIATAAGDPPDVAGVWDAQITQFAGMNALECLDDMHVEVRPGEFKSGAALRGAFMKPVFYDACCYNGKLYGMPSTPGGVALHYNKRIFRDKAKELRAAGLDPTRAPRSIAELDAYSKAIETFDDRGNLTAAGFLPQEPGWWMSLMSYWFYGSPYDPATRKITFTHPNTIKAYKWVESYSRRLGPDNIQAFRAANGKDNFDSPISPFFTGAVAMMQEGPWKANYVERHNPQMNNIRGLTPEQRAALTRERRRENCDWGAVPFPDLEGRGDVGCCNFDSLVVPRTGKHKQQAKEFVAFVNRPDVMEKLVSLHCKTSPLAHPSEQYIQNHPNPYIEVFEELASSPNAHTLPQCPIWPEVKAELDYAADRITLGEVDAETALREAELRAQAKVDQFFARQQQRDEMARRSEPQP